MLSELLKRAEAGEPLWLPELRAAFAAGPGASPLILRLTCPDGAPRDYALPLPAWKNEAEKDFLRGYLCCRVAVVHEERQGFSFICRKESKCLLNGKYMVWAAG